MTNTTKPLRYQSVASVLLALCTVLAGVNWYLRPERAGAWTVTLLMLACMTVVVAIAFRPGTDAARRHAADGLARGVVFGGLILAASLAIKLAIALGAMDASDLPQRITMVILGAFFVFTGNAMPKTLSPLATMQCDPARSQALHRLAGWTWVLTGFGFALAWSALPIGAAQPVSLLVLVTGVLIVITQLVRSHSTRQGEA